MAAIFAATLGLNLKYGDVGVTAPATALANIKEITALPTLTADEFEITRINDADGIKEFAAGLGDPGTLEMVLGFAKADIALLYPLFRITKKWLITFSDASTLTFDGFIKMIGPEAKKDDEVTVKITIRATGLPAFVAGA